MDVYYVYLSMYCVCLRKYKLNLILVRSLLELDVNPCASDSRQRTALHFAAAGGHTEVGK